MNTDQLHDAIGMLPEDLVAEVDALRRRPKPKIVYWKKILPTAACAAIILISALTLPNLPLHKEAVMEQCADEAAPAEAAPEAAKAENKVSAVRKEADRGSGQPQERSMTADRAAAYPLAARYLPVQPSSTGGGQRITVISSREELDRYLAESDPEEALKSACESYDQAYFEGQQLVLLLTVQYRPAASYSGNVLLPIQSGSWSAEKTGDTSWTLRVQDLVPDVSAQNVVRQHIILELPDRLIARTDTVILEQAP